MSLIITDEFEVVYSGGSQAIRVIPIPPWGSGRVATATYEIVHLARSTGDSERTVQASGAATVDSFSTTTDAASGPTQADATALSVDDASGATAGTVYMVQDAQGRGELLRCRVADEANDTLYAHSPLTREYESGSPVLGVEVSGTFPAVEANDESNVKDGGGPYAAIFSWTWDDGTVDTRRLIGWLRRSSRSHFVSTLELQDRAPRATESLAAELHEKALRSAHADYWRAMKVAHLSPDEVFNGDMGGTAVLERASYYLYLWRDDEERADRHLEMYREAIENLKTGRSPIGATKVDTVDDVAPSGHARTIRSKFVVT